MHLDSNQSPNYENPLDAEKDNQYNATLRVYDSNLSTAVPVEKTFSITVNDSNEAPVLINPSPTFWFNYRHTLKVIRKLLYSKNTSSMWMVVLGWMI